MPNRVAPPSTLDVKALSDLSKAVDSNVALPAFAAELGAKVQVEAGDFRHLAPRATGMEVTIPAAEGKNFGKRIVLFINGALGSCRVRPITGTINGATSFTLAAGYVTYLEMVSNGKGGWATGRAAGYPTAGHGLSFTGDTLNVNLGAGLAFDLNDDIAYVGSGSNVNTTPTAGDLNVVDISALNCGGVLSFQSVTEANIDGFSVPASGDGFWFFLCNRDATTSDFITLIENNGNTTTSIRTPNTRDWRLTKNESVIMYYSNSRWRCVASFPKPWVTPQDSVTWAAQQDNFARTSRGIYGLRVTLTGTQTLTGVVPDGITPNGELLYIENIDSVDTLIILHDATSTTANRFFLPDSVNLRLGPRSGAIFRYDDTTQRWRLIGTSPHGRLLTRTVLTTGTAATFTHDPAARTFLVRGVGGGGAGGGAAATAGSLGSGGGSGTYGEKLYTIGATTSTYTVGVAGTGNSGAAGGNGTASTWLHNAVTLTLPSGNGGGTLAGAGTVQFQSGGLGGGSATNADWFTAGERGDYGMRPSAATTPCCGGKGGSTPWGVGGSPGVTNATLSNGAAGGGPGAGGGGQANGTTATASAGPNGFDGQFIVEEYS